MVRVVKDNGNKSHHSTACVKVLVLGHYLQLWSSFVCITIYAFTQSIVHYVSHSDARTHCLVLHSNPDTSQYQSTNRIQHALPRTAADDFESPTLTDVSGNTKRRKAGTGMRSSGFSGRRFRSEDN